MTSHKHTIVYSIHSDERWLSEVHVSLQENVLWEEYADGSLSIYQNVMCTKNSQKVITTLSVIIHYYYNCLQPIIIGRGGEVIKAIASEAASDLETALGRPVKLFLYVKS